MASQRIPLRTLLFPILVVALLVVPVARGGELEPPGPPEPTMKPLSELEPRHPIWAGMLPLTISEPGSFYLAETISAAGGGITITTGDVTIDLNGFSFMGGTGVGIYASAAYDGRIVIRNGTVRGWGSHGIHLPTPAVVTNVRSEGNGGIGILVGDASVVTDCVVSGNDADGISTGVQSDVRNSTILANGNNGIQAGAYSRVKGNLVRQNSGNGVRVEDSSYVQDNFVLNNGGTAKAGIFVTGDFNHIDGNFISWNTDMQLRVNGAANTIVRNTVSGWPVYDIAPDNLVGPCELPAWSTSPWANLQN